MYSFYLFENLLINGRPNYLSRLSRALLFFSRKRSSNLFCTSSLRVRATTATYLKTINSEYETSACFRTLVSQWIGFIEIIYDNGFLHDFFNVKCKLGVLLLCRTHTEKGRKVNKNLETHPRHRYPLPKFRRSCQVWCDLYTYQNQVTIKTQVRNDCFRHRKHTLLV